MGRSHAKALKDWKSEKDLDSGYIEKYKSDFPAVSTVVCICKGKRHSAKCGCLMALLKLPDETSIVLSPSVVTVLKRLHVL